MTGKQNSFKTLIEIRDIMNDIRSILGVLLEYKQEELQRDGKLVLYELAEGVDHWVIEALARIHQEIEDEGHNDSGE